MTRGLYSSGEMLADRRAQYADMLAESGDWAGAAELMQQALAMAPRWAAGWSLLAKYYEEAGKIDAAVDAWRQLAEFDQGGLFGAALKLAAYGAEPPVPNTPIDYVRALFDDYAGEFESSLLGQLSYRVPEIIETRIAAIGQRTYERALDLGCGTGLMGARLRDKVAYLEGVDLSAEMIKTSRKKGIYDKLQVGELVAHLETCDTPFDLVTAADVFIYCGELPPIFAATRRAMTEGGRLAFSVELHDGREDVVLRPSLRFAHSRDAVLRGLAEAGFETLWASRESLRHDRGEPVAGLVVVATAIAASRADSEAQAA